MPTRFWLFGLGHFSDQNPKQVQYKNKNDTDVMSVSFAVISVKIALYFEPSCSKKLSFFLAETSNDAPLLIMT